MRSLSVTRLATRGSESSVDAAVAERLAADGEHVLRFDYYGTGDSGGNADAGSFDGWVADTRAALQDAQEVDQHVRHCARLHAAAGNVVTKQ